MQSQSLFRLFLGLIFCLYVAVPSQAKVKQMVVSCLASGNERTELYDKRGKKLSNPAWISAKDLAGKTVDLYTSIGLAAFKYKNQTVFVKEIHLIFKNNNNSKSRKPTKRNGSSSPHSGSGAGTIKDPSSDPCA